MKIKLVVRLRTSSYFVSPRRMKRSKELTLLSSKSNGSLDDLIIDVHHDIITNIHEVPDGLYELTTCDETRDWETGQVDGFNLMLVPHVTQVSNDEDQQ